MIKGREDIDELFKEVLIAKIKEMGHGAQSWIARRAEVSPQEVNRIVKGRIYGSEKVKRAIAGALGHEYEEFLNLGRKEPAAEVKETLAPYRSRKDHQAVLSAVRRILRSDTSLSEGLRGIVLALDEALTLLDKRVGQKKPK